MLSSSQGLRLLHAGSFPAVTTATVPRHGPVSPGGCVPWCPSSLPALSSPVPASGLDGPDQLLIVAAKLITRFLLTWVPSLFRAARRAPCLGSRSTLLGARQGEAGGSPHLGGSVLGGSVAAGGSTVFSSPSLKLGETWG